MPDPSTRHWTAWDALTVALGALVVGAHAAWIAVDERIPRDLGNFYEAVPRLAGQDLPQTQPWRPFLQEAAQTGGWLNVLHAGLQRVAGPSADLFASVDLVWLALLLLATGAVARHLGGPRSGTAAMALLATSPLVVWMARQAWIHVPEAALVMGVLALIVTDPDLRRWRSVAGLVVCGGLALWLRESAVVWMGLLVVLGAWRTRHAPWSRRALVAGAWAIASWPAVSGLLLYVDHKRVSQGRHATTADPLWIQLFAVPGRMTMGLVALGLLAGGIAWALHRKAGGAPVTDALPWTVIAWLAAVPATVENTLRAWAAAATRVVLTHGVLVG